MTNQTGNLVEAQKGGVVILRVKGKLDSILSPVLEKRIIQFLNEGQNKLLLDFSDITHVNSSGLRMLLSVKKQIRSFEGTFIVCCLRNDVLEMMKICGFDHVLDIAANEEEALRKF